MSPTKLNNQRGSWPTLLTLVLAGEAIFFLPFVIARVFRPTLLDVFQISNLQLGTIFSVYGIVAMASYFFGGPLADRFQARKLMAYALVATALGGLIMASIPNTKGMKWLYAFWGFTTIFLFWAALIRSTRLWGGNHFQGRAFGWLDAGRGASAALISTAAVGIFSLVLPSSETISYAEQKAAFRAIIYFISAITFLAAVLVWIFLPPETLTETKESTFSKTSIKKVFKLKGLWLQSVIIICAYVGYKITDDFSLYAHEVMYMDEVSAATVGTLVLWMRPVGALMAGIVADKTDGPKMILILFILMLLGGLTFGSGIIHQHVFMLFVLSLVSTSLAIYALRALYFSIMNEAHIPPLLTGTAVGIVSFIGYTPDIFMGPLMGYLLDNAPGVAGHQHVFLMLSAFSIPGIIASWMFIKQK